MNKEQDISSFNVLILLRMVLRGHVWSSCMIMCGQVWPCVVMCGPVWPCVVMCGPVWSWVVLCGLA